MTDDFAARLKVLLGVSPKSPKPSKKQYTFAPGYSRCMDCRCRGNGECKGENKATRDAWRHMLEWEMR